MGRGAAIGTKIKNALTKLKGAEADTYIRTITKTGTGSILHKYTTATNSDVIISPRPTVRELTADEVQGSAGLAQPGDKMFILSNTVTRSDLETSAKALVYRSMLYRIVRTEPYVIFGTTVGFAVTARQVSETS